MMARDGLSNKSIEEYHLWVYQWLLIVSKWRMSGDAVWENSQSTASMKPPAQHKLLSVENSVIYSDLEEGERHHAECCWGTKFFWASMWHYGDRSGRQDSVLHDGTTSSGTPKEIHCYSTVNLTCPWRSEIGGVAHKYVMMNKVCTHEGSSCCTLRKVSPTASRYRKGPSIHVFSDNRCCNLLSIL